MLAALPWLVVLIAAVSGLPHANVKRQVGELRDRYDFIIAGGGTAGLTVADRLTEAFPNRSVLVIEYGKIEEGVGVNEPLGAGSSASLWAFASLPMTALWNRSASLIVGQVVGGSSVINGQWFGRGSRWDYNDWKALGSPEFDRDENKWDWDGLLPWFKKSVTFKEPSKEEADTLGYTWDVAAYNGSGPIQASFPPFQWPMQKVAWKAWLETGLEARKECSSGDKHGLCWLPNSQDPITAKRSHAGIGHYQDIKDRRPNLDLLIRHKVTRVVYGEDPNAGPPKVEIQDLADRSLSLATANLEVIIAAGAIHTPQILQRSGIGYAKFLESAGIKVTANVPGVGYNFHDHGGPPVEFSLSKTLTPNANSLTQNVTFRDESVSLYAQRPAKGPYTLAMGNSAIYVSLSKITSSYKDIIANIRGQIATAQTFLPSDAPPEVIAGYKIILETLANSLSNPEQPVLGQPFNSPSAAGILLKPLSRGTVMINISNHDAEPLIDYRTATNPIDLDILANYIPFFRNFFNTPTMKEYGAKETRPGAAVQSPEAILQYLRTSMTASFMHPCCTAAMMPKSKGGVVGTDLRVYGVAALSVVDCSIMPILPGSQTSATAYAIGEKGADIIIRRWSK